MNKKGIILAVVLFALVVVGMFTYAYLKKTEIVEAPTVVVEEEKIPYPMIERIDAKHYYIDGTHTFVGELVMPTPCDLLDASAVVMESYPEQIQINFNVINNSEMCAQVLTTQRFKVTAIASSEATVSANFMGRNIDINLIPAAAGEVPEEFELFIKG